MCSAIKLIGGLLLKLVFTVIEIKKLLIEYINCTAKISFKVDIDIILFKETAIQTSIQEVFEISIPSLSDLIQLLLENLWKYFSPKLYENEQFKTEIEKEYNNIKNGCFDNVDEEKRDSKTSPKKSSRI